MLHPVLIGLSALALLIAIALLLTGTSATTTIAIWIGGEALIVLAALLLEQGRYRSGVSAGPWERTAERFQDPTTGRWVTVEFNPRTGERRYVEET